MSLPSCVPVWPRVPVYYVPVGRDWGRFAWAEPRRPPRRHWEWEWEWVIVFAFLAAAVAFAWEAALCT